MVTAEQIHLEKCTVNSTECHSITVDGFSILIFLSGTVVLSDGTIAFEVQSGESVLLRSQSTYTLCCEKPCEYLRMDFSRESFYHACLPVLQGCPLLSGFFIQNCMTYLHFVSVKENIASIALKMYDEYRNKASYYESVMLCELMALLLTLTRSSRVETSVSSMQSNQQLQTMLDYIVNHSDTITLASLAEVFHFHPNTVSAILKKGTGKSFQQLLEQTRMSRVSEMLLYMPVQTAAETCGYKNMSNFYARFQKHYGMTPGEYAQRMRPKEANE